MSTMYFMSTGLDILQTISMYSVLSFNGESRYHISLYFFNGQKYL